MRSSLQILYGTYENALCSRNGFKLVYVKGRFYYSNDMRFSSKLGQLCFLGHGVVVYSSSREYQSLAYRHHNLNPERVMLCVRFHSKPISAPRVHWPKGDSFLIEQYRLILSHMHLITHRQLWVTETSRATNFFIFFSRTQTSPWRATIRTSRCGFEETTTFILPV